MGNKSSSLCFLRRTSTVKCCQIVCRARCELGEQMQLTDRTIVCNNSREQHIRTVWDAFTTTQNQ